MNENYSQGNRKPNHVILTPPARAVLDSRRKEIFAETGVLKPRYEIASEAIIAALGRGEK